MAALTTRAAARARAMAVFEAELDRLIPADESVPLKGSTFAEFEDQIETLARSALPVVLEERAALGETARVESGGRCPECGSQRVYLRKGENQKELQSPHGKVVLPLQHARCRACGCSFSPSGS